MVISHVLGIMVGFEACLQRSKDISDQKSPAAEPQPKHCSPEALAGQFGEGRKPPHFPNSKLIALSLNKQ